MGCEEEVWEEEKGGALEDETCIGTKSLHTTTALPVVLAHSSIITIQAMIMSIVGGLLIYGTIVVFGMFFQEEQDF